MEEKITVKAWLIWFAATLFVANQLYIGISFGLAAKYLAAQYSTTISTISNIAAVSMFAYGIMQIPVGIFIDKISIRKLFSISAIAIAISFIIMALNRSVVIFYILSIIIGVLSSYSFVGAIILNNRWFSDRLFSVTTGMTSGLNGLLASLMVLAVSLFISNPISNRNFIFFTIPSIIVAIIIVLFIKDYPDSNMGQRAGNDPIKITEIIKQILATLGNLQIVIVSITVALTYGAMLAFITLWFAQYQRLYSLSTSEISIMSTSILSGTAVGSPIFGYISEKIGKRKIVLLVTYISLLAVLLIILQPKKLPYLSLFPIFFLLGFFSNSISVAFSLIKENSKPNNIGIGISLSNTFLFLGMSLSENLPSLIMSIIPKSEKLEHVYISPSLGYTSIGLSIFPIMVCLAFLLTLIFVKETNAKMIYSE